MPIKRKHEEHENHERWLVSYADFITLLFAFFVVMYSTSSVNEGKYRVLSDSLMGAFSSRERSLQPIQVGNLVRSPPSDEISPATSSTPVSVAEIVSGDAEQAAAGGTLVELGEEAQELDPQSPEAPMADSARLASGISKSVLPQIDKDLVEVRLEADRIEIELKSSILFPSGSARLVEQASPMLEDVATVLKGFPNPIRVEGFTDNVPIRTVAFPSNWELSAARAASVVHLFMKYGVRPERMTAIGHGEYRPVADNRTSEGRRKNRRVVIVIPTDERARERFGIQRLETPSMPLERPFGSLPANEIPDVPSQGGPAGSAAPDAG